MNLVAIALIAGATMSPGEWDHLSENTRSLPTGNVVYTHPACAACWHAKAYLKKKGVLYKECDIRTKQCRAEFDQLNGYGTPLLIINGVRMDGFSRRAIDRAIGS